MMNLENVLPSGLRMIMMALARVCVQRFEYLVMNNVTVSFHARAT